MKTTLIVTPIPTFNPTDLREKRNKHQQSIPPQGQYRSQRHPPSRKSSIISINKSDKKILILMFSINIVRLIKEHIFIVNMFGDIDVNIIFYKLVNFFLKKILNPNLIPTYAEKLHFSWKLINTHP